ncbi:hypothetical protein [Streptomyces sp. NPDC048637]|uniref:hypothetical protein n=1 Tax=Streptomyces sp. NPDC048637 TaxID=3155636 RepID=UPI00342C295A
MDLEGIGALSAAGVALIGIPATMLVGRWQLKAALRAAEASNEVGMAQADSAYRAALDAVRAEANAAHIQWQRGVQREVYASFLLAAHRPREVGERFAADSEEELSAERIAAAKTAADDVLAALKAAQTIIELEGPDDVAAPAAVMTNAAQTMAMRLRQEAVFTRAWGKLSRLTEHQSEAVNSSAQRLMRTLSHLRLSHRSTTSSMLAEADENETHEARAARQSCHDAWSDLTPGALDEEEFDALVAGHSRLPPTFSHQYVEAAHEFDEAEVQFVRAARTQLHSQLAT